MSSTDSTGRIVVPLDGSKNAENALPYAALFAGLYRARVDFVHVIDHESVNGPDDLAHSAATFSGYATELADHWRIVKHGAAVLQGPAAAMILEFAAGATFIVIASHGHGGFHATFIGSVADKVVRGAQIPVVLVPGVGGPMSPDPQGRVLIGLDGSELAEKALQVGRDLAVRMGGKVTLIRAWMLTAQGMPSYDGYGYYPDDSLFKLLEANAQEYLKRTARPDETALVVQGSPAPMIAAAAARLNAGLVVVASSGKGLASRIALGSTTDRLMHSLHRPLVIVPE